MRHTVLNHVLEVTNAWSCSAYKWINMVFTCIAALRCVGCAWIRLCLCGVAYVCIEWSTVINEWCAGIGCTESTLKIRIATNRRTLRMTFVVVNNSIAPLQYAIPFRKKNFFFKFTNLRKEIKFKDKNLSCELWNCAFRASLIMRLYWLPYRNMLAFITSHTVINNVSKK